MLFVTFLVAIYYNMIIAWTLFYTFAGFQSQLPWEFCGNEWNTLTCYTKPMADNCTEVLEYSTYWNNECTSVEEVCKYYDLDWAQNELDKFNVSKCYNTSSENPVALDQVSLSWAKFVETEKLKDAQSLRSGYDYRKKVGGEWGCKNMTSCNKTGRTKMCNYICSFHFLTHPKS